MAVQGGLCLTWLETPEDTFYRVVAHLKESSFFLRRENKYLYTWSDCPWYFSVWAMTQQNVSSGVSDQARHKPACAATEAS